MTLPAIGLSGFAKSGKTAASLYIEEKYGIERHHIAEPLRHMLHWLLRDADIHLSLRHRYLTGDLKEHVIPELGVSGRHLQVTLGTEWGRRLVSDDLWVNLWKLNAQDGTRIMNDSVRFPNEESAVHALGGITILIVRPETQPIVFKWKGLGKLLYRATGCMWGVHDSERTDRLKPDHVIVNDGTLEDLYADIDCIMAIYT